MQGFFHYGPLAAGRRLIGAGGGSLSGGAGAARIHEGVVWSNRDRRTLLDKLSGFALGFCMGRAVDGGGRRLLRRRKVARALLACGHHLVTRVRSNGVAYLPPPAPKGPRRGRPALYGMKNQAPGLVLRQKKKFLKAPSPVYGETGVVLRYYTFDLIWRPFGPAGALCLVIHPTRGRLVLLSTDLTLEGLEIIRLYGWRFKNRSQLQAGHPTPSALTPTTSGCRTWTRSGAGDGAQHTHRQFKRLPQHFAANWPLTSATSSWA